MHSDLGIARAFWALHLCAFLMTLIRLYLFHKYSHPQTKQKIQKDFPNDPLFSQVFLGQEPQVPFQDPPDWDLLRKDALVILLTNLSIGDLRVMYPQANIFIDYPKSKTTLNL